MSEQPRNERVQRREMPTNALIAKIEHDVRALRRRTFTADSCFQFCVMLESGIYAGDIDWLPDEWIEVLAWALREGESVGGVAV